MRLRAWASCAKIIVPRLAEHAVGPSLEIDAGLLGGLVNDVTRNELEHLPENIDVMACWLGGVSVF